MRPYFSTSELFFFFSFFSKMEVVKGKVEREKFHKPKEAYGCFVFWRHNRGSVQAGVTERVAANECNQLVSVFIGEYHPHAVMFS